MNRLAKIMLVLLVFAVGVAAGLGIALYLEMRVLMVDQVIPAVGTVWS